MHRCLLLNLTCQICLKSHIIDKTQRFQSMEYVFPDDFQQKIRSLMIMILGRNISVSNEICTLTTVHRNNQPTCPTFNPAQSPAHALIFASHFSRLPRSRFVSLCSLFFTSHDRDSVAKTWKTYFLWFCPSKVESPNLNCISKIGTRVFLSH